MTIAFALTIVHAQTDTADAHVAAARKAAGVEHKYYFDRICVTPSAAARQPAPEMVNGQHRSFYTKWHADPVKVFDNLYFVGQTEYSSWALTTSSGIIILDTIFDYSVENEVVNGLRTMGLDPSSIKYVIVGHGHYDHAGGARYLQDHFHAHVIMSAADWDLLAQDTAPWPKPKRDMVATDGQQLTLGDTTLTIYVTPGHTLGTLSLIFPVFDHGERHVVAEFGGGSFNWVGGSPAYITPDHPARFWFDTYAQSARRFMGIVKEAHADVLISNHTAYDGSTTKLPAMTRRKPGDPHPYVVGTDSVLRYLTVGEECAMAGLVRK